MSTIRKMKIRWIFRKKAWCSPYSSYSRLLLKVFMLTLTIIRLSSSNSLNKYLTSLMKQLFPNTIPTLYKRSTQLMQWMILTRRVRLPQQSMVTQVKRSKYSRTTRFSPSRGKAFLTRALAAVGAVES